MSAYASQNPLISQGISGLVEHSGFEPLTSTMRMSRATNCANAPWWFSSLFLLCEEEFLLKKRKVVVVPGTKSKGETRTGRHFLNAGRLSESAGEQMSEAVIFLPNLAGGLGLVGAKVRLPRPTNCANAHSLPYAPSPLHSPKDMRKFRQDN